LSLFRSGALTDHHERRPEGWMCFSRFAVVDHGQHGPAQGLRTAERLVARGCADRVSNFTVAAEPTDQCEANIARAPA
jgi:hypothetical protein